MKEINCANKKSLKIQSRICQGREDNTNRNDIERNIVHVNYPNSSSIDKAAYLVA